jgi:hypothetical protein
MAPTVENIFEQQSSTTKASALLSPASSNGSPIYVSQPKTKVSQNSDTHKNDIIIVRKIKSNVYLSNNIFKDIAELPRERHIGTKNNHILQNTLYAVVCKINKKCHSMKINNLLTTMIMSRYLESALLNKDFCDPKAFDPVVTW